MRVLDGQQSGRSWKKGDLARKALFSIESDAFSDTYAQAPYRPQLFGISTSRFKSYL